MKNSLRFAGRALAAAGALLLASGAASAQVVIKMATLVPEGSDWHRIVLEMVDQWRKAGKGQIDVRLYPGGRAGDDVDVVRKMRLGTLNAALLTSAGLTEIDRGAMAMEIPMAYAGYGEFDCALDKVGPAVARRMQDKGFELLGWADAGYIQFFTKSPVRTPDDLRRLKMFAWAGDDQYVELWKSAGFNPVPLPSTELATALKTGLVGAVSTTPQVAVTLQYVNDARNMTEIDWAVLAGGFVVSKATWEKIPADVRPQLLAAAREAGRKLSQSTRAATPRDLDAIKRRGVNVVTLAPADRERWTKLVESVYSKVRGPLVPADMFDMALRSRDECRAKKAGR